MCNKQKREVELLLEFFEQIDDLCLNNDI